jgi:hypothetical protein
MYYDDQDGNYIPVLSLESRRTLSQAVLSPTTNTDLIKIDETVSQQSTPPPLNPVQEQEARIYTSMTRIRIEKEEQRR